MPKEIYLLKKFLNEFKEFIMRGNVLDLAVAVLVGAAFQSIVTSLTDNIISPVIGLFTRMNFDQLSVQIPYTDVIIKYGAFITSVINFLIMALIIFLIVKVINKIMTFGRKRKNRHMKKQQRNVRTAKVKFPLMLPDVRTAPQSWRVMTDRTE